MARRAKPMRETFVVSSGIERFLPQCLWGAHDFDQSIRRTGSFNSGVLSKSRGSMQQLNVDGPDPINWSEKGLVHGCHHFSVFNCCYRRQNGSNLTCKVAGQYCSELLGNSLHKLGLGIWVLMSGYQ